MKICSKCHRPRRILDFAKHGNERRGNICKKCSNATSKRHRDIDKKYASQN